MTIEVEQIKKLIDDYWGYERECSNGKYDQVSAGRAALYRTVIMDFENLLPRKSVADIPVEEWPNYVGTWVEYQEKPNVLAAGSGASNKVILIDPKRALCHHAHVEEVFPLDHDRAWDAEGNPV